KQIEQRNKQQNGEQHPQAATCSRGRRSRPPYQSCHEVHILPASFTRSAAEKPALGTGAHGHSGRRPINLYRNLSAGKVPEASVLNGPGSQKEGWAAQLRVSSIHPPAHARNPYYRLLPVRHNSPLSTAEGKKQFLP